ncbi:MAG: response regulator transcription factor [Clostridia bacterium]|nr:response regulator transcription factor [Clostridia bacterium]
MEQEVSLREQKKILLSYKKAKMRIAVCDINKEILEKTKNTVYKYADCHRLDIVVDCYSRGEELLCSKTQYNLIFLGYELHGKNGLETAASFRIINNFSSIVFISKNTDFVFEAFKVSPYRFLIPPINQNDLYKLLDDFFAQFGTDYPLWIKNGEDTFCLNTREIVYLEADNKHSIIHLQRESIPCNRTMAKVFEVLPKNHFIKINRAYIVNLNFIAKYNNDTVFFKNGDKVHISRNYSKNFKEEYRFFLNPLEP